MKNKFKYTEGLIIKNVYHNEMYYNVTAGIDDNLSRLQNVTFPNNGVKDFKKLYDMTVPRSTLIPAMTDILLEKNEGIIYRSAEGYDDTAEVIEHDEVSKVVLNVKTGLLSVYKGRFVNKYDSRDYENENATHVNNIIFDYDKNNKKYYIYIVKNEQSLVPFSVDEDSMYMSKESINSDKANTLIDANPYFVMDYINSLYPNKGLTIYRIIPDTMNEEEPVVFHYPLERTTPQEEFQEAMDKIKELREHVLTDFKIIDSNLYEVLLLNGIGEIYKISHSSYVHINDLNSLRYKPLKGEQIKAVKTDNYLAGNGFDAEVSVVELFTSDLNSITISYDNTQGFYLQCLYSPIKLEEGEVKDLLFKDGGLQRVV